jgi:hypothetical protein
LCKANNPNVWTEPQWSADFGDPAGELDILRVFSNSLIELGLGYSVELNCFEDGYMNVDIFDQNQEKVAELHVVSSDDYIFGLFFDHLDEEIYFNRVADGLTALLDRSSK